MNILELTLSVFFGTLFSNLIMEYVKLRAAPQAPVIAPKEVKEEKVPYYCDDEVEKIMSSYDWYDELMVAIAKGENGTDPSN